MVAFSYPGISLYSLKPIGNSLVSVALVIYLSCFIKVVKGATVHSYKSTCKNDLMSLILANQKLFLLLSAVTFYYHVPNNNNNNNNKQLH